MKTYDQRMEAVLKKAKSRKIVRTCLKTTTTVMCILAVIIGIMHIPYGSINAGVSPTNGNTHPTNPTNRPTHPPGWIDPSPVGSTSPADPTEVISVNIWMLDEGMARFTHAQIDRFNQINTLGIAIDATIEWADAYVSADYIAQDVENAPDLYCFRQDDLMRLVDLNALTPLGDSDAQWVKENNLSFNVDTATYDDQVFAFPLSYQNAMLLYYDRSVISDEDAKSLTKVLSACEAADKKFCFETESVESIFTFFLATGCNSQWYPDAAGNYTEVVDTLNSKEGRFALLGMLDILNSPVRTTVVRNGMSSNTIMEEVYRQCGAVISFSTNGIVELAFGDNLGITVLPTFEQYDSTYQLHSFADSIMMGIKPQENARKAVVLAELAKFLTGEECQLERYERIYWMVPSNTAALEQLSQEEPLIAAMVEQSQYVVPNMLPHVTEWWDIARDIVERFENDLTNEMTLKLYAQRLEDMLDPPTGIWSVHDGYLDIDMVEQPDGTWRTKEPLYLSEKDGFIIRYEHSYDQACYQKTEFGSSYWKPGVAGYYHIFFDPAAWQCTWELQSQQE